MLSAAEEARDSTIESVYATKLANVSSDSIAGPEDLARQQQFKTSDDYRCPVLCGILSLDHDLLNRVYSDVSNSGTKEDTLIEWLVPNSACVN